MSPKLHEASGVFHRVPSSLLGPSLYLRQLFLFQCYKTSQVKRWERVLELCGACPENLSPFSSLVCPPSSLLLILSFSKSSDYLLWAQPWAGRCLELEMMIQNWCLPWGAPALERKEA